MCFALIPLINARITRPCCRRFRRRMPIYPRLTRKACERQGFRAADIKPYSVLPVSCTQILPRAPGSIHGGRTSCWNQESQLLCTSRLDSWHMARSEGCRISIPFIRYSHNNTDAEVQNGIDLRLSLGWHSRLRDSMAEHTSFLQR